MIEPPFASIIRGRHGPRHQEDPTQVDRNRVVPLRHFEFPGGARSRHHTGIVGQDVNPSELLFHPRDQFGRVFFRGDVAGPPFAFCFQVTNLANRLGHFVRSARAKGQPRPLSCVGHGDGAPDASPCTGNQDHFVLQFQVSLSCVESCWRWWEWLTSLEDRGRGVPFGTVRACVCIPCRPCAPPCRPTGRQLARPGGLPRQGEPERLRRSPRLPPCVSVPKSRI